MGTILAHTPLRTLCLALAITVAPSAYAVDLGEKGKYGKVFGDFRYRYEHVEQVGLRDTADASTARLRLGYETPKVAGFTGLIEGETIQYIGSDNFNDGSNGKSTYPSVNDPMDTAVNRAYISYTNDSWLSTLTLGRQYLVYDNHRFIGWSKFRQNDTTHDAVRAAFKPIDGLNLEYAHSISAHRAAGSRQDAGTYDGSIDIYHADYQLPADVKLIGYGYFLDFDDFATSSSRTIGSRVEWRTKKPLSWSAGIAPLATIEYARQQDYGNNTRNYDLPYNLYEIGGTMSGYTLSATYERMGGNGTAAMSTPLATAHSFTGWVDRIDTPPARGLVDMFATFKGPIPLPWESQKLAFETQLHHFTSDVDDVNYGKEVDASLTYTPIEDHTIIAKIGQYYANRYLSDTTKFWLYYETKF